MVVIDTIGEEETEETMERMYHLRRLNPNKMIKARKLLEKAKKKTLSSKEFEAGHKSRSQTSSRQFKTKDLIPIKAKGNATGKQSPTNSKQASEKNLIPPVLMYAQQTTKYFCLSHKKC